MTSRQRCAVTRSLQTTGVCLHRSPKLLAAVLGVLKAGAAYVPLDPTYPQDRLSFMVADAGCRVIVTEEQLRPVVSSLAGEQIVAVDTLLDSASGEIRALSGTDAAPTSLA